jgi:hypothetical protein
MVSYKKYSERAFAAEATSILSDIKIKQEAYRATFRQYAGCGANAAAAWAPDNSPGAMGRLWPPSNAATAAAWQQLGIKPDNDLYYAYYFQAGAPGTAATDPFDSAGIGTANDFWYAARAVEDLNGDGKCSGFEIYHGKASIAELKTADCPK